MTPLSGCCCDEAMYIQACSSETGIIQEDEERTGVPGLIGKPGYTWHLGK
jgi:hypothetical protein